MFISVFDLFTIGIGPSSSHSVGPMRSANMFIEQLERKGMTEKVHALHVTLYGSLAWTGKGHHTDLAIMMGLQGEQPESVNPDTIPGEIERIRTELTLRVGKRHEIHFNEKEHLKFNRKQTLPLHSNGMTFLAKDNDGGVILERTYYSVGGGFIVDDDKSQDDGFIPETPAPPYPFTSCTQLLEIAKGNKLSIAEIAFRNELTLRGETEIRDKLLHIWEVMQACVTHGFNTRGTLPGQLEVKRRAADLYQSLCERPEKALQDPLTVMDWVNAYALSVSEENAAGGRVVTAPTNGAAGVIPAVMHYYHHFYPGANEQGIIEFLLTAGAIAALYKQNASISGAEVGCQGEVGVACSMAAGGLAHVSGGSQEQVEQAAEIGMEHNLGLTCDPVGGLVQVPCIERNAMGAVKAINAARLALRGDGTHCVSLDRVIKTMRDTGADMKSKYKETSRGGLAVNVIEC